MTLPRPLFIALLGIAVMSLWGGFTTPGVALVGLAAWLD
jgi:hypothetical protein